MRCLSVWQAGGIVNKEGLAKERGGASLKALRVCRVCAIVHLAAAAFEVPVYPGTGDEQPWFQYDEAVLCVQLRMVV